MEKPMKRTLMNHLCGWALLACPLLAEVGPLELYYTSAAAFAAGVTSQQALPVGNGKLAGMVYGGVDKEVLQFNEDTVWAGTVHDYTRPGAHNFLADIQAKVWQGEGQAAYTNYAAANFMSDPIRQSPYVGTGVLEITTGHSGASQYRRSLDLETATARVSYVAGGVTYTRETFASYPDKVIVMKFSASQAGKVSLGLAFSSLHTDRQVTVAGNQLVMSAKVNNDTLNSSRQQTSEIRFQARVEVRAEGGSVSGSGSSITVTGADAVVLVLHVASNFVRYNDLSADPGARAQAALAAVSGKGYDDLRAAHVADYQELFNRVELDLGTTADAGLPTDQRLANLKAKIDTTALKDAQKYSQIGTWTSTYTLADPQLITLNFQMARYLMIAGSRPGSQPMNLQGKWCNELNPSWESKMTLNINQEMNYWAAEAANLAETHVPMVDLVRDLAGTGAIAAQNHYNARGWMVHHNTDLWRGAAPINNPGGLWPSGGAWLSMHLWWHYQYSMDPAVLAEIYPLMKGAAEFFVDFLVMDPRTPSDQYAPWGNAGQPQWGKYLLTNPSHSPEQANKKLGDNGELVAGPMMDNQLIRALFSAVIEAGEILGVDADFRDTLAAKRALLPPNMIGKLGQLQEWLEDVDVAENPVIGGHRHLSHLLDLFPGEGINPHHEPEFAQAAKVVLDWKGDPSNNTSWSRAWKMNLRAALGQGDHAFMILTDVLGRSHTANMTFSNKGNTEDQIDGNLGVLMGTAQFFMQSRRGEIELLPALPTHLHTGSVRGLRAKGGFEVDVAWAAGTLTEAVIRSAAGTPAVLRTADPVFVFDAATGNPVDTHVLEPGVTGFETSPGAEYQVVPASSVPTWLGYPVRPDGNVDTGDFIGWVYVGEAPYVWNYALANWIYADEAFVGPAGGWVFIYRPD
jgi:alpha-L-fucosidase 2